MPQVFFNGEKREVPGEVSILQQLLEHFDFAVSEGRHGVEQKNVARKNWPEEPCIVGDGDRIEVVHFRRRRIAIECIRPYSTKVRPNAFRPCSCGQSVRSAIAFFAGLRENSL